MISCNRFQAVSQTNRRRDRVVWAQTGLKRNRHDGHHRCATISLHRKSILKLRYLTRNLALLRIYRSKPWRTVQVSRFCLVRRFSSSFQIPTVFFLRIYVRSYLYFIPGGKFLMISLPSPFDQWTLFSPSSNRVPLLTIILLCYVWDIFTSVSYLNLLLL